MRAFVMALAALGACSDPPVGKDTGSTCPPVDPPDYASFGMAFFETYCLDCHSQTKMGDARNDAPVTIDFDTRTLVREHTSNIDKQAAWGPNARNVLMPPSGEPKPTDDERRRLGEYIACEIGR
ncbi:MAG: hypothetical protein ACKV2T_28815 [Kofleriaceae bacterium]